MEATDEEKVDETAEDEEREKSDEEKWAEIDEDFDRDEGPFDIEEVDLDQDDVQRIDLGGQTAGPVLPGGRWRLSHGSGVVRRSAAHVDAGRDQRRDSCRLGEGRR